jgi:hypothetical protein
VLPKLPAVWNGLEVLAFNPYQAGLPPLTQYQC